MKQKGISFFFGKSHKIQTFHSHRVPIITYLFKKITRHITEKSRKKPENVPNYVFKQQEKKSATQPDLVVNRTSNPYPQNTEIKGQ